MTYSNATLAWAVDNLVEVEEELQNIRENDSGRVTNIFKIAGCEGKVVAVHNALAKYIEYVEKEAALAA